MILSMKPNCALVMLCLLLAFATAIGGVARGRAAGMAIMSVGLTEIVLCADGTEPKTIWITRDGSPVDLPHCSGSLCEDCLQAGSVALLAAPPGLAMNDGRSASFILLPRSFDLPVAVFSVRSRAPPVAMVDSRKPLS